MRSSLFLSLTLFLSSCGISESFDKLEKVKEDLEFTTGYYNIMTGRQTGTDKRDDKFTVTFLKYKMAGVTFSDLDSISLVVKERLMTKHFKPSDFELIIVQFTDGEDVRNMKRAAVFRYPVSE